MAYIPIPKPTALSPYIMEVIEHVLDPCFEEIHYLLTIRRQDQGPKGSYQKTQAMVLIALADGMAQLFIADGKIQVGDRFKKFLEKYYPWDKDMPDGFSRDEAVNFIWDNYRCPLFHRLGLRHSPDNLIRYGNVFSRSEDEIESIESCEIRPSTCAFLEKKNSKEGVEYVNFLVESFYWGLRQAITNVFNEPREELDKIENRIRSGDYDPIHSSRVD